GGPSMSTSTRTSPAQTARFPSASLKSSQLHQPCSPTSSTGVTSPRPVGDSTHWKPPSNPSGPATAARPSNVGDPQWHALVVQVTSWTLRVPCRTDGAPNSTPGNASASTAVVITSHGSLPAARSPSAPLATSSPAPSSRPAASSPVVVVVASAADVVE